MCVDVCGCKVPKADVACPETHAFRERYIRLCMPAWLGLRSNCGPACMGVCFYSAAACWHSDSHCQSIQRKNRCIMQPNNTHFESIIQMRVCASFSDRPSCCTRPSTSNCAQPILACTQEKSEGGLARWLSDGSKTIKLHNPANSQ